MNIYDEENPAANDDAAVSEHGIRQPAAHRD